eukprot:tig00000157_g9671.t1
MEERCVSMPEGVYERLREYAQSGGERTLADAVAALLDSDAGIAPASSSSDGSATRKRKRHPDTAVAAVLEHHEQLSILPLPEQLPDVILSEILEHLGLQAAAAARAVCRRWRDAVEAIRWRRLDVKLPSGRADQLAGLAVGAQALGLDLSRLDYVARADVFWQLAAPDRGRVGGSRVGGRWIRVASGASLRLDVTPAVEDAYGCSKAWRSTLSLLTAFSATAGAASGASAGGLGEVEVDCSCAPSGCLAELLKALAPPGAAAYPALRRLALREGHPSDRERHSISLGVGPDFPPLVFPNLDSLSCDICCCSPGLPPAEALALCLPNLKRLEVRLEGEYSEEGVVFSGQPAAVIGRAAAAFPSLQVFKATDPAEGVGAAPDETEVNVVPLIETLASGPAALSLKECVYGFVLAARTLHRAPADRAELRIVLDWSNGALSIGLHPPVLRALGRFPALERFDGIPAFKVPSDLCEDDLAALGSLPSLKGLGMLHFYEDGFHLAAQLNGLAAALERSSSLADLQLVIWETPPQEAIPALARLIVKATARGRFTLLVCWDPHPAAGEDVLAALGSCPALTSLGRLSLYHEDGLAIAGHLNNLAEAFERSRSLASLDLEFVSYLPKEALPALARLAGAARGGLSLQLRVEVTPECPGHAEVPSALAAAPPRRLALNVYVRNVSEENAVARLGGLSAFAGCSTGDIKVRLDAAESVWDAARAAVARALPVARVVRWAAD